MFKPLRLLAVLFICAALVPATGSPSLRVSAAPNALGHLANARRRGELLGSGWLDRDQYRPDHRGWRSGCQPKCWSTTACHWFSSGYRRSSRRDT